jgi:hypothetical protein
MIAGRKTRGYPSSVRALSWKRSSGCCRVLTDRPKDWADSYLLAFANSSELTLVTFDRRFLHRYHHVIVL